MASNGHHSAGRRTGRFGRDGARVGGRTGSLRPSDGQIDPGQV